MNSSFTVSAPSRLHFGLLSVGNAIERQFGGVGLMIQSPRTIVQVSSADHLTISGPEVDDCQKAATLWFARFQPLLIASHAGLSQLDSLDQLPVSIQIQHVPRRHCGLGSGTQLAMSVAAGLTAFFDLPMLAAEEMSASIGRGKRSAIGSYGFFHGGLLVDRGLTPRETIAPLDFQTEFPDDWPILLVMKRDAQGLFGPSEAAAFHDLPNVTAPEREAMSNLVRDRMIPGVLHRDFDSFGEAVYEFGYRSGLFFQSVQGGPYNGSEVTHLVQTIRGLGVKAVGQTSWGPCVFAIVSHHDQAVELKSNLHRQLDEDYEIVITCADNFGARLTHNQLN